MSTKRDLQKALDATIKQRDDALKKEAELRSFVKNLFYLHPPLKKAYYGSGNPLLSIAHGPKFSYVASLAEAERNVAMLSSADLAKIDLYLKAALEEEEEEA